MKTTRILKKMSSVAGAGKTTALKRDLKNHVGKKTLLITFNKSLEEEAKPLEIDFPGLSVSTYHGLAFNSVCKEIGDFTPLSEYKPSTILELGIKGINSSKHAVMYIKLISMYCHSSKTINKFIGQMVRNESISAILGKVSEERLRILKEVWNKLVSLKLLTHDAYAKLYQLQNPTLNFDVIMVDEYQDFSESMISVIVKGGKNADIYLAGDDNQRIYEWRGACGVFPLEFNQEEELFASWRCPKEFVEIANPYTKRLSGVNMSSNNPNKGEVIIFNDESQQLDLLEKEDITFLTRTNSYAFVIAEKLARMGFNIKMNSNVNVEGLEKHWQWINGIKTDSYLDDFEATSKDNLISFYRDTGQDDRIQELNCAMQILDMNFLKEFLVGKISHDMPTATISTVYRAKGLGFKNVFIASDFKSPLMPEKNNILITDEDLKLLYVAITRAKEKLYIGSKYVTDDEVLEIHPDYTFIERQDGEEILLKKIREATVLKANY